jgi:hypothetical protein
VAVHEVMQAELQAEYQLRRARFLSLILQSPPTSVDRPLIDFALAITMHLLNTFTLKLKQYIKDIPPYAILSHTWGDEEVTFDDIDKPCATSIKEYQKIRGSCELVRKDGFEWIWVDTCCIDKKSSAELSEAINSMYKWYWRAEVCYVYLSDVPHKSFMKSTWFSRGWTLQELLAPSVVEFYSQDWTRIGTKSSLSGDIRRATGIETKFFLDRRTNQVRLYRTEVWMDFSPTSDKARRLGVQPSWNRGC